MRLSRDHRIIIASFESVPGFTEPLAEDTYGGRYETTFQVGPFKYMVTFAKEYNDPDENNYEVFFKISSWDFSSPEEMVQIVSKMAKKPLDYRKAREWLVDDLRRYGITNLGDSRPILAGVVDAIKRFVDMENPDYLFFDAYEPKRRRLYEAILRNLKGKLNFEYASEMDSNYSLKFTVHLK